MKVWHKIDGVTWAMIVPDGMIVHLNGGAMVFVSCGEVRARAWLVRVGAIKDGE